MKPSAALFGPRKGVRRLVAERGKMMGGNHRPSAPFCRETVTLYQFVMRYSVPADGTSLAMTEPAS
jgi:hypothetical protein